ncbi:dipeptidase [Phycisphaerales bacterium AB-hyl4]|uniref:Dipeptidase n=1 Tax=Natronomicrosphaera hydrolytica TaxID=3242702 RepID=A0ABV4U440_9BACT
MPTPLDQLNANRDAAVDRLTALLRIPSVSTDPAYASDVNAAADWVADHLRASGLDARIMPTAGHPVVYAATTDDQVTNPDAPRLLFYGHYDVQPPDPIDKWTTPPFEPTVRDGSLYARGASDDKGQIMCFLEALRAYHDAAPGSASKLPCHVTVLIEGEEECGSVNLPAFIEQYEDLLRADVAVVSDTSMWDAHTPAITYALRGLLYFDIQLHGPSRDLHSGVYGGTIPNPATILTQVLGNLFDENHRVTIPGYYDHVQPLTDDERQLWQRLAFNERNYLNAIGLAQGFGETGYTTLERRWSRPACDINGLYGGYGGEGAKTVIPSFAGAKVSFRLAADQQPDHIADAFNQWLNDQPTHGLTWKITEHGRAYPAAVPTDSPWIAAASKAIEHAAGRPPVLVREGATIPVIGDFKRLLDLDSLLIGFGLNGDNIHSPDEHLGLDRFHLGCQTHAALLQQIANTP